MILIRSSFSIAGFATFFISVIFIFLIVSMQASPVSWNKESTAKKVQERNAPPIPFVVLCLIDITTVASAFVFHAYSFCSRQCAEGELLKHYPKQIGGRFHSAIYCEPLSCWRRKHPTRSNLRVCKCSSQPHRCTNAIKKILTKYEKPMTVEGSKTFVHYYC
jgi:hypothetical protein